IARLWSSGFELNSLTAGVEITSVSGSPTIVTSPVRSGTYALRTTLANRARYDFATSDSRADYYFRVYIRFAASPSNFTANILRITDSVLGNKMSIQCTTSGTLILRNEEDSANIGSPS